MTLMLRRMAQLFFVVFLFVSFLETGIAHSEGHSRAYSELQGQHVHAEKNSAEKEEHCPFKDIYHCCHTNVLLKSEPFSLTVYSAESRAFFDFDQRLKPSPFLEGPFQPPRT